MPLLPNRFLVRLLYPQAHAVAAELAAEPQDRLITRSQP